MQFCKKSGQSISNGALMDIRVSYLKTNRLNRSMHEKTCTDPVLRWKLKIED